MEAIVNQNFKKEEKKVHPMFRRTSTNNSTSTDGMDDMNDTEAQQPRKRRKMDGEKVNGTKNAKANGSRNGKVKEEPIELVDSDDDLDQKPVIKGSGRANESPSSDEDDPQALFKVDQSRSVSPLFTHGLHADGLSLSPLGYFLQTSMLSTDTQSQEDEGKQPVRQVSPGVCFRPRLTETESDDHYGPRCKRSRMACGLHSRGRTGHIPLLSMYRGA